MNGYNAIASRGALSSDIRKTLTNTFVTVGGMWAITSLLAYMTLGMHMGFGSVIALFVGCIACIFGVHAFRNSGFGLVLLAVFAGLEGASLGPLLNHYLHLKNGVDIVMTAAGLTGAATFACAAYSIVSRRSFSRLGGFLFAGLVVVLVASLLNLFFHSTMFSLVISGAAALVFTLYLLHDISAVVTGEETNYITASLSIFLDMYGLLVNLLRIFGILGSSDD